MTPDRWNRLRSLYDVALDTPPEQRARVLASSPDADPELVDEVLRMIARGQAAGDLLHNSRARNLRQELLAHRPLLQPGDLVSRRFRVERLLGSGGMGEVYAAADLENQNSLVALKTLRPESLADETAHRRLRREALLASKISHPNVCRIFDVAPHEHDGVETSIIVMEFLDGPTLQDRLKQQPPLSFSTAENLLRQCADALASAHAHGVIHRDFKPSNVILAGTRAVVTDFGLATPSSQFPASAPALSTLTATGQLLGTPEYMAPEQLRNQEATERSDIYSFGVVAFELFTGQRPTGSANGIAGIAARLMEPPPAPRTLAPNLPLRWNNLILHCLERDPRHRIASIQNLLAVLNSSWPLHRLPRPSRRTLFVGGALSVFLGALGVRYWIGASNLPNSRIVMAPIENKTGNSTFNQIGLILNRQIAQSGNVRIVEARRLAELAQQMAIPKGTTPTPAQTREMAIRDGASGVLSGELRNDGATLQLHLRLDSSAAGPFRPNQSFAQIFPASSPQELFPAIEDAARWTRQHAGETAAQISRFDRPSEDVTTNSWEAWRLYTDAQALASKSDLPGAIALLEEATRLDPVFVMAWRDRADLELRRFQYAAGYRAWQSAIAVLDQRKNTSIEAYRTRATYLEDSGQFAAAEKTYRTLLALLPGDYLAQLYLSSVLDHLHRPEECLAILESLTAQFPDRPTILTHSIRRYLATNRPDLAQRDVLRLESLGQSTWAAYGNYSLAMTAGDTAQALHFASAVAAAKEPTWRIRGKLLLASYYGYQNDIPEVLQILQDSLTIARTIGDPAWLTRLPLWVLYMKSKLSNANFQSLLRELSSHRPVDESPESIIDSAFVAHILGHSTTPARLADWPDLPVFDLPRAQLHALRFPSPATIGAVVNVAARAASHRQRSALEFAIALCRHHGWPSASFDPQLAAGRPSFWWGNELSIPARLSL